LREHGINAAISDSLPCIGLTCLRIAANFLNQINPIPPVQSPPSKIFRFLFPPNQRHNSPVSSSLRGAYRDRHGRWDGMRWTRQRRARDRGRRAVIRERSEARRRPMLLPDSFKLCGSALSAKPLGEDGPRTAKPCGPGTRCWCQAGGGEVDPTGLDQPLIRQRRRQDEFVSGESSA